MDQDTDSHAWFEGRFVSKETNRGALVVGSALCRGRGEKPKSTEEMNLI
jgi:hypothetical protein